MVSSEVVTGLVVVAGGAFTFAGYSYHRYDTLQAEASQWLSDYFRLQASRQATALSEVLRFTLPDLVQTYFDTTPAETPLPVSPPELRELADEIDASPDDGPALQRRRLIEPMTRRVVARIREQLDELGPGVLNLPAVQAGLMTLHTGGIRDSMAIQHEARTLSKGYLVQALLGLILGLAALGSIPEMPLALPAAFVFLVLCIASASLLEVWRDRIRERLRLERSSAELAR